jgi:hypothetical protein
MILLKFAWPYLLAALLGAAAGAGVEHLIGSRQLAETSRPRARPTHRGMPATWRRSHGQRSPHDAAASPVAAVDGQLTKERIDHEAESRSVRAALAAGTERLGVAVRNCTAAGSDGLPGAADAAGVGDGAAADIDPVVVAERVFGVTGDDPLEIDKLKAVQGWA